MKRERVVADGTTVLIPQYSPIGGPVRRGTVIERRKSRVYLVEVHSGRRRIRWHLDRSEFTVPRRKVSA